MPNHIIAVSLVLVVFVLAFGCAQDHQCDYPCPATFVAAPQCGRNKHTAKFHTFRTDCVLFCYNKLHPENQYVAFGTPLKTCTQLGEAEEPRTVPYDQVSEFDL